MKHNVKQYLIKDSEYFNHESFTSLKNVSLYIPNFIFIYLSFVEIYIRRKK